MIQALEIESTISALITDYESYENIPEDAIAPIIEYEKIANDTLGRNYFYLFFFFSIKHLR